jgi:small subunit ribosomal protein S21
MSRVEVSRPLGCDRVEKAPFLNWENLLGCKIMAADFLCSSTDPTKPLERREVSDLASVVLRPNESSDSLLKRFRKKVVKSGILSTVRRKRWFISKSELRRVEKKKAIRRIKRRQTGRIGE